MSFNSSNKSEIHKQYTPNDDPLINHHTTKHVKVIDISTAEVPLDTSCSNTFPTTTDYSKKHHLTELNKRLSLRELQKTYSSIPKNTIDQDLGTKQKDAQYNHNIDMILPNVSTSFRSSGIGVGKQPKKSQHCRISCSSICNTIKNIFLIVFIIILMCAATVELGYGPDWNPIYVFTTAIIAYLLLVLFVWIILFLIIFRGRIYYRLMNWYRPPTFHYASVRVPTTTSPVTYVEKGKLFPYNIPMQSDDISVANDSSGHDLSSHTDKLERTHSYPLNPLEDQLPKRSESHPIRRSRELSPIESMSSETQEQSKVDITQQYNIKKNQSKIIHINRNTFFSKESDQSTTGISDISKRMNSDADLVLFYWNAQKQQIRRNQLQMAPKHFESDNTGFIIPSVMTTGQISSAFLMNDTCIRCGKNIGSLPTAFCDECINESHYNQDLYANNTLFPNNTMKQNANKQSIGSRFYSSREHQLLHPSSKKKVVVSSDLNHRYSMPALAFRGESFSSHKRFAKPFKHMTLYKRMKRLIKKMLHPLKILKSIQSFDVPLRSAVIIHHYPAFQLSLLLRNFCWCGVYIWATTLISRKTSKEHWDTSNMPSVFWFVEAVFMWMITWDYIIALLAAPDSLRLPSLVDLLTMPTAKAIVAFVETKSAVQYSIYFGSLRVLRLVRIEGILSQVMPWISQVKLRLISLGIGAFVIILMFASAMFVLESPYDQRSGFVTLYDFVFFAVVTISTVGYGDFSPSKPIAKAIVMVAIITALTFLPTQIQKLISALQTPPRMVGRIPHEHQDYITISGPIDPYQLTLICRELSQSLPGCCSSILVITPNSVVEYTEVIRSAFLRSRIRVSAIHLQFSSIKLRTYYRHARAVFIVGDVRAKNSDPIQQIAMKDPEAIQLEDDHNTLLRFLGAQHVCWPDRPICVQLNDGTTKHLVTEMGAYHVVCLQHIKMKLMAKSCAGCPGFVPLITNLFHRPLKELDAAIIDAYGANSLSSEAMNIRLYFRGARYQLYRLEFPECFYGIQFTLLVRILAVRYDVLFIGVSCVTKEFWLNPIGYRVGDELNTFTDWPFAGIVAAPSLRTVQKIAAMKNLNISKERIAVEDYVLKQKKRDQKSCIRAYFAALYTAGGKPSPTVSLPRISATNLRWLPSTNTIGLHSNIQETVETDTNEFLLNRKSAILNTCPSFASIGQPTVTSPIYNTSINGIQPSKSFEGRETAFGLLLVDDIEDAIKHVFKEATNPLIVICGWPRGVPVFLSAVLRSMRANIVILAPYHPSGLSTDALLPFIEVCAWVKGSGLDVADLLRAGVLQARSCAVFSCPHVPWKQSMSAEKTDTQAVLVREFVYALHHSDSLIERRLQHTIHATNLKSDISHQTSILQQHSSSLKPYSSKFPINDISTSIPEKTTLEDIHNTTQNQLTYDRSTSGISLTPLVVIELRRNNCIEFLNATPLTKSFSWSTQIDWDTVWAQEGLCAGNPEFTSGRVLLEEMLHGIISFSLPVSRFSVDSRVIDQLVEGLHIPLPEGIPHTCPIWLEDIPESHYTSIFGDFMDYLLRDHLKLPISIYRPTRKFSSTQTPLDLLQGEDSFQYVVITCPPLDMPLQQGDQVYVIHACPKEALGMLLTTEPTPVHLQ